MLPDRVLNPGPLTYESGALSIALRGPAQIRMGKRDNLVIIFHISPCKNMIGHKIYFI